MLKKIMDFMRDEEGASAVEYGLIIGLIAVALVVILGSMGTGLKSKFQSACTAITGSACAS